MSMVALHAAGPSAPPFAQAVRRYGRFRLRGAIAGAPTLDEPGLDEAARTLGLGLRELRRELELVPAAAQGIGP